MVTGRTVCCNKGVGMKQEGKKSDEDMSPGKYVRLDLWWKVPFVRNGCLERTHCCNDDCLLCDKWLNVLLFWFYDSSHWETRGGRFCCT